MEEGIEAGNAFAIPDLYKPSSLIGLRERILEIEDLPPLGK